MNSINPGVVITELQKRGGLNDEAYKGFLERSRATHPLKRVAHPDEVAALASFLVSNEADFITGDCIEVDGGRGRLGAR